MADAGDPFAYQKVLVVPEGPHWKAEWDPENFDWRDDSLDEQLAKDWLANERLWWGQDPKVMPDGYDLNVAGWAQELVQTDLAPERGWRLILRALNLALDDGERSHTAITLLETFLREHAEAFLPQIESAAKADPRFVTALRCVYLPPGRTGEVIRRLAESA